MYKRRDWMHLHGEDGGDSDSSADDSSDDEAAVNRMAAAAGGRESNATGSSSDSSGGTSSGARGEENEDNGSGSGSDSGSGPDDSDSDANPSAFQKLEDISEDDFDEGEFNADLEDLKRVWLNPATPATLPPPVSDAVDHAGDAEGRNSESKPDRDGDKEPLKGQKGGKVTSRKALKCRVCDGKLLLNPLMLRQHIASKKHIKRCTGDPEDPICFAESLGPKENVETHQERSQRVAAEKRQQEQAAEAAQAATALKLKRRTDRKRKRLEASAAGAASAHASAAAAKQAGHPAESHQQQQPALKKKGKVGKRQRQAMKQEGSADGAPQQRQNKSKGSRKPKTRQKGSQTAKVVSSEGNRAAKRAAKRVAFAASNPAATTGTLG